MASRCSLPSRVRTSDAKMIQSMQRAVDRGASLTQQLLAFGRQQPLKAGRHDLNAVIRDFEPMLRRAEGREYPSKCARPQNPG